MHMLTFFTVLGNFLHFRALGVPLPAKGVKGVEAFSHGGARAASIIRCSDIFIKIFRNLSQGNPPPWALQEGKPPASSTTQHQGCG